jgi:hypothetical protein
MYHSTTTHHLPYGGGCTRSVGSVVSYDADALDYFSRAETLGGSFDLSGINATYTEAYVKTAISDFIAGCKTDAIWTKLTEVYLLAGVSFDGLMAKLKHAGTATLTNNGPFVSGDYLAAGSGAGLVGNGSSKRLGTGLICNTFMTAGSASLGIYAESLPTSGTMGLIGVADAASATAAHAMILQSTFRRGLVASHYTSPTSLVSTAVNSASSAFEIVSRISSTNQRFYRNGVPSGSTNTNAYAGSSAGSIGMYSLRYGTGTGSYSHSGFSAMRAKFAFAGLGLTDTDATNLSTRVNALMTAIGANVY